MVLGHLAGNTILGNLVKQLLGRSIFPIWTLQSLEITSKYILQSFYNYWWHDDRFAANSPNRSCGIYCTHCTRSKKCKSQQSISIDVCGFICLWGHQIVHWCSIILRSVCSFQGGLAKQASCQLLSLYCAYFKYRRINKCMFFPVDYSFWETVSQALVTLHMLANANNGQRSWLAALCQEGRGQTN